MTLVLWFGASFCTFFKLLQDAYGFDYNLEGANKGFEGDAGFRRLSYA